MASIDRYLIHSFGTAEDERAQEGLESASEPVLPMLVRVSEPAAVQAMTDVVDCRVTSRMGDIVACTGSIRTIEALQKDSRILSIEVG